MTQGLGAAASHALFERSVPRAWLLGGLATMAPDLDVLIRSETDPLLAIEHHRGFTHALAFIPVGGVLTALPSVDRQRPWSTEKTCSQHRSSAPFAHPTDVQPPTTGPLRTTRGFTTSRVPFAS